eukprot:gene1456-1689_t
MSSAQIYQVPVVSNGLREPESILQIVDALDKLDKVFAEVYTSISSRVSREKARIDHVASRLNNAQEGLGHLPHHIPSVSNLLLFNTQENPYKKYSNTLDNLSGTEGNARVVGEKKKLGIAPVTVEKGDILPQLDGKIDKYTPVIANFQSHNFPSVLPLSNVAENINWAGETSSGIAPSNQVSASLPIFDASPDAAMPSSAPSASQPQYSQQPPTSSGAPPPPPPPSGAPPPPPPPPPPSKMSAPPPPPPPSSHTNDDSDNDNNDDDDDGGGTAMGSLLADIRKGHKNRLKKVAEGDEEGAPPPPPKKSGGGDVMSDLFLALSRRRESIASTKKKPAKPGKKQQDSEDEEEEEQDSDWDD